MTIAIIVLLVGIVCIQLFVKHKVVLNGLEGTSGVFNKSLPEPEQELETQNPVL